MSDKTAEQVLSIDFQTAGSDREVYARLDDAMNSEETTFAYGVTAYFQVFSNPVDLALEITLSDGSYLPSGSGSETFTEYVAFANSDRGNLTVPAREITSWTWLGNDLGSIVHLGGSEVKSSRSGVGVLKVTYTAQFRRFSLTLADPEQTVSEGEEDTWPVLVVIRGGEEGDDNRPTASLEVEFYGDDETYSDYTLYVVDACTDEPIQGVSIYLDGNPLLGLTGPDGAISCGNLLVGSVHTATVNQGNYDSFDADFTVPAAASDEEEVC